MRGIEAFLMLGFIGLVGIGVWNARQWLPDAGHARRQLRPYCREYDSRANLSGRRKRRGPGRATIGGLSMLIKRWHSKIFPRFAAAASRVQPRFAARQPAVALPPKPIPPYSSACLTKPETPCHPNRSAFVQTGGACVVQTRGAYLAGIPDT